MSRFRRWTAGVVSRVDWLVTKVENHQALADSTLFDMRRALNRAHAQLGRVERDGDKLRRELSARRSDAERWRDRARDEPDGDRALECLRRARAAQRRVEELTARLEEHEQFETKHRKDIQRLRERVDELLRRRNQMRTRASRAQAAHALQGDTCVDVDDVFECWEEQLCEQEVDLETYEDSSVDPLEAGYLAEEERRDLEQELRELRGES